MSLRAAAFAHRHHDRLYRLWRDAGRPDVLLAVHRNISDGTRPALDSAWPDRNTVALDDWDVGGCSWTKAEPAARHWFARVERPDTAAKPGFTPLIAIAARDGRPVLEIAWIDRIGSPHLPSPRSGHGPAWLGCLFALLGTVVGLAALTILGGFFSSPKPDPTGLAGAYSALFQLGAAAIFIVLFPFAFWMGYRYFRPRNRRSARARWAGRSRRSREG